MSLNTVELIDGIVRSDGAPETSLPGVRVTQTGSSFELHRSGAEGRPVYYRIGYGRLQWCTELTAFAPDALPAPDPGTLLALLQGQTAPPEAVDLPGVRRLALGSTVRVDVDGVTVDRRTPELPRPPTDLLGAVGAALPAAGTGFAIAYSGGLGSASVAAAALAAGRRPVLVHADLGLAALPPPADVPGLELRRVRLDVSELLDHNWITGAEPLPPMPEVGVRRRMVERLAGTAGAPLVGGALLEDLLAVKLPDVDAGFRGRRLLACEPFHISGTLRTLAEARELLGNRVVYSPGTRDGTPSEPDAQAVGAPPPPSPTGGSRLPWLTPDGKQLLETAQRGAMAVWQDNLDLLDPVVGRLVAGLEERGDAGIIQPAMDVRVLAAAAAIPAHRLGRVRHGAFQNHLPLRRAVDAAGIGRVRHAAPGFWLRLAAADHVYRERKKLIAELERECALGDLGVIEPMAAVQALRDGHSITDHALPLLRLVWLDRWLRGRS